MNGNNPSFKSIADDSVVIEYMFIVNRVQMPTINITVAPPIAGETPSTPKITIPEDAYYTVDSAEWTLRREPIVGNFQAGVKDYWLIVNFAAKDGYSFYGIPDVFVNGEAAEYVTISKQGEQLRIEKRDFLPLTSNVIGDVSLTVTPPEAGKAAGTPDVTVPVGANYTVKSAKWFDKTENNAEVDGNFIAGHTYRATIDVAPKDGYAFHLGTTALVNGNMSSDETFLELWGIVNYDFVLTEPAAAKIVMKNAEASYKAVDEDYTTVPTWTYTLENTGNADFTGGRAILTGDDVDSFTVSPATFNIPAGGQQTVTVTAKTGLAVDRYQVSVNFKDTDDQKLVANRLVRFDVNKVQTYYLATSNLGEGANKVGGWHKAGESIQLNSGTKANTDGFIKWVFKNNAGTEITGDDLTAIIGDADVTQKAITITMPAKYITAEATWKERTPQNKIKVTYIFYEHGKNLYNDRIADMDIVFDVTGNKGTTYTADKKVFEGFKEPSVWPSDTVTFGTDTSLNLRYEAQRYTVTWDFNGGTNENGETKKDTYVYYRDTVTSPYGTYTRDGYTFAGWEWDASQKMPAHDLTIKAIWIENEHEHDFTGVWKNDANYHWHECTANDGATDTKVAHVYDNDADATCNVCSYERTISPVTYTITNGNGQTVTKGNTANFVSDAPFEKFVKVQVDSADVAASNYTAVSGSTDVTFTTDYINSLSEGNHTIAIVSDDGQATGSFTVKAAPVEPPHSHDFGTEWKSDADNHWKECSCGEKSEQAAHDFKWVVDTEATADKDGSKHEECTVCGYKKDAVKIPATGTTKPTDPTKPSDSTKPGDNIKPSDSTKPSDNIKPADNQHNASNTSVTTQSPKTGDTSNIVFLSVLMLVSFAGIALSVFVRRKFFTK